MNDPAATTALPHGAERATSRWLYLIRHGATEANLRRPYVIQGQRTNTSLLEQGRRQAEAARRILAERPITSFYSSPLQRAIETAEIIAKPHGRPVTTVSEITECDVGRWEGLSWETVRQHDNECWLAFEQDPGTVPYAGGESFLQVQQRAVPAIDRLIQNSPPGDMVVVTHNVVARAYLAYLAGIPIAKARAIRLDNCGISIVSVTSAGPKLLTLNSVFHLDGLLIE